MSTPEEPRPADPADLPPDLPGVARGSWHGFLETYEPLRSELYRYCRHLTRSPWDAEDLAQDTLARAFVTVAQMGEAPKNPRAWLFRVASNLWIDQRRRLRREQPLGTDSDAGGARAGIAEAPKHVAREAAGTLIGQLAPQERAAVVLKDVFDLSLEEVAEALSTTPGAIKAALHRARGKLAEPAPEAASRGAAPAALDAFCKAFNAGDMDGLTALLLESASVEVVGATTMYGPEAARRTVLFGMLHGVKYMADPNARGMENRFKTGVLPIQPRVEAREHRGEWLLLHWYTHDDGEAVRAITRLDLDGDSVTRLQNYFFTPDFVADVCGELGLPFRPNGYRWYLPSQQPAPTPNR